MPKAQFHTIEYQTMALAAVFTALQQVHQIATTGSGNETTMFELRQSIFKLDSESPEDIYPGKNNLISGYRSIDELIHKGIDHDNRQTLNYWVNINRLAKALKTKPKMLARIHQQIDSQTNFLTVSLDDNSGYKNMADIDARLSQLYQDTLSTLSQRINIQGLEYHLTQPRIKDQVRMLLLASIRAITLWHQLGGNVIQFIWHRKQYTHECRRVTTNLKSP